MAKSKSKSNSSSSTTSTSFWDHPIVNIQEALHIRKRIDELKAKVDRLMHGEGSSKVGAKRRRKKSSGQKVQAKLVPAREGKSTRAGATQKKQMSPEGRARIAAAQKARWAAKKETTSQSKASTKQTKTVPKTRKIMSPEAREKIAAARKARWAAKKATAQ
jgi:hypothetical protein